MEEIRLDLLDVQPGEVPEVTEVTKCDQMTSSGHDCCG